MQKNNPHTANETHNEEEHNGWTNRETWLVSLWLGSDEQINKKAQAIVTRAKNENDATDKLQSFVENQNPLINQANLYNDLLNNSFGRVNWREVATSFMEQ